MIAVDTGLIVALFDKNDNYHSVCHNIIRTLKMPLATTVPVLTEAFYLLSFSWQLQDDLLEFIVEGNPQIYNLDRDLMKTCRELMRKYHDLPIDLADASLVAVADAENIRIIFTLDKDFKVYKTKQNKHFKLLPGN
jgi:predicted nucleic acid-binding protein